MIGLKESFRLIYSNTHLRTLETLPLIIKIFLTGYTGGPGGRNLPGAPRQAGEVPEGLVPVIVEVDGGICTGVGAVGVEVDRLAIPV